MTALRSHLDVTSETYQGNRGVQLELLTQPMLPVRERLELLLDPDSRFPALSALAAR